MQVPTTTPDQIETKAESGSPKVDFAKAVERAGSTGSSPKAIIIKPPDLPAIKEELDGLNTPDTLPATPTVAFALPNAPSVQVGTNVLWVEFILGKISFHFGRKIYRYI